MTYTIEELILASDQWTTINPSTLKVTIVVLLATSSLAVVARAMMRLLTHQHPLVYEYFLYFSVACLAAATGGVYMICDEIYVTTALLNEQVVASRLDPTTEERYPSLLIGHFQAFLGLCWTATYVVKFSVFAFFEPLMHQRYKIRYYYWTGVTITILSWAFVVAEPFLLCPYFDWDAVQCFQPSRMTLFISMTALVTGLDIFTDLITASIPIMVLNHHQFIVRPQIGLAIALCRSVMAVISVIRIGRMHNPSSFDLPWAFFFQFLEASAGVILGSITLFRAVVLEEPRSTAIEPNSSQHPLQCLRKSNKPIAIEASVHEGRLPDIPSSTMTGLRSFIQGNRRISRSASFSSKILDGLGHSEGKVQSSLVDTPQVVTQNLAVIEKAR